MNVLPYMYVWLKPSLFDSEQEIQGRIDPQYIRAK